MSASVSKVFTTTALVAVLGVMSACGDSSSSTGTTTASSTAEPTAKIDDALGVKFAGGTPGKKATGAPIKVGWVNNEGGSPSDPESTVALKAGLAYINERLGGVNGRPIELVSCFIVSSEEQGQVCGQKLVNNPDLPVIVEGQIATGAQSLHQTIAGKKPVIIQSATPGPDTVAKNAYALNSAPISGVASMPAYAKSINAKSASIISSSLPLDLNISKQISGVLKKAGMQVKLATFPQNSTDLTTPLAASGAAAASVSVPTVVTPDACIAYAKAAQQTGLQTPTVVPSLCLTENLKKAMGDYPKWTYQSATLGLAAPDDSGQVAFYKAVMAKYAGKDAQLGIDAPYAFGAAFALANILNHAGEKPTTASVAAAAKEFHGPVVLGQPELKFGVIPPMPTVGGAKARYYTYEGDGKWSDAHGWIG